MVSLPAFATISTIGGSRLLLNVRAAYFSSIRNRSSTAAGHRGNSDWLGTEGTVGRFWTSEIGGKGGDDDDGECAASISMGVWSNEDVQRNRTPSPDPPVIMLQPVPPGRRRWLRRLGASEAEGGTASSDGGLSMGPGVDDDERLRGSAVSVSSFPEPQASRSTMIGAGMQRTKDPDVELGGLDKG
ncbi:hypothetical protein FRC04_010500 [Tulasnella sp. 424]|nr:hypothetical protein FRC04_010500 [Tulasnella sp. 424]KAG8976874.1 hypothetical protein FRC05_002811 [Tulasnella sp. 425]